MIVTDSKCVVIYTVAKANQSMSQTMPVSISADRFDVAVMHKKLSTFLFFYSLYFL